MNELPDWFYADRLTVINYYGYPSYTVDRFYELPVYDKSVEESRVMDIARFHDLKRKCMQTELDQRAEDATEPEWVKDIWDNKVVIECKTELGHTVYVGYKDLTFSLGLGVRSEYRKPYPYRQAI